jgi:hypothetical protein
MESNQQPIVSIIIENHLRIHFPTTQLKEQLQAANYSTFADDNGYFSVRFRREHSQDAKNIPLIELVLFLNDLGIAFSGDYTQAYPPSYLMSVLQNNFILKKAFRDETRLHEPRLND